MLINLDCGVYKVFAGSVRDAMYTDLMTGTAKHSQMNQWLPETPQTSPTEWKFLKALQAKAFKLCWREQAARHHKLKKKYGFAHTR
jgi:hypothetical protein